MSEKKWVPYINPNIKIEHKIIEICPDILTPVADLVRKLDKLAAEEGWQVVARLPQPGDHDFDGRRYHKFLFKRELRVEQSDDC